MLLYFIKVNIALGLLYILYRCLFRNDTFFRLRRITLLVILLLAFLYPFPDIKGWIYQQPFLMEYIHNYSAIYKPVEVFYPETENGWDGLEETVMVENVEDSQASLNWTVSIAKLSLAIYGIGVLVLLFRTIAEVVSVYCLYRKSRKERINGINVYVSSETEEPFSFFKWIFIDPEKYNKQALSEILIHEETHVRQIHSLDMVLAELVVIFGWINPFAWMLKKEICINHEYMADQEVMNAGFNKKEYQYHLIGLEHTPLAAANLYNYFSVLPLKKRITMLNKKRMHRARTIKYLALLPLAAALLIINNIDVMARIVSSELLPSPPTVTTESVITEDIILEQVAMPAPPDDKVYTTADIMPQYPGGDAGLLKFVNSQIVYPSEAKEKGIQGRVVVSFIVEKDGTVKHAEITRGIDPLLDAEALRVMTLLQKWTPGKDKGEVVRVKYTVPVQFRINKNSETSSKEIPFHKGEKVYAVVDKMPRYPDGGDKGLLEFISKELNYPVIAFENGIQGRVVVSYVIEKDGTPAGFKIERGIDPSLDKEALRILAKMNKWTPGEQEGEKVQVRYVTPVTFKIEKNKENT